MGLSSVQGKYRITAIVKTADSLVAGHVIEVAPGVGGRGVGVGHESAGADSSVREQLPDGGEIRVSLDAEDFAADRLVSDGNDTRSPRYAEDLWRRDGGHVHVDGYDTTSDED